MIWCLQSSHHVVCFSATLPTTWASNVWSLARRNYWHRRGHSPSIKWLHDDYCGRGWLLRWNFHSCLSTHVFHETEYAFIWRRSETVTKKKRLNRKRIYLPGNFLWFECFMFLLNILDFKKQFFSCAQFVNPMHVKPLQTCRKLKPLWGFAFVCIPFPAKDGPSRALSISLS